MGKVVWPDSLHIERAPRGTLQDHQIYSKTFVFLMIPILGTRDLADCVLESIFRPLQTNKYTEENVNVRDGISVAAVVVNDYKPKVF